MEGKQQFLKIHASSHEEWLRPGISPNGSEWPLSRRSMDGLKQSHAPNHYTPCMFPINVFVV